MIYGNIVLLLNKGSFLQKPINVLKTVLTLTKYRMTSSWEKVQPTVFITLSTALNYKFWKLSRLGMNSGTAVNHLFTWSVGDEQRRTQPHKHISRFMLSQVFAQNSH